jgi:hypothetical protein
VAICWSSETRKKLLGGCWCVGIAILTMETSGINPPPGLNTMYDKQLLHASQNSSQFGLSSQRRSAGDRVA